VEERSDVEIRIPPGIETGTRLRVRGEGEPAPDGYGRGDLFCDVVVKDHPIFDRDGPNLICELPISYSLAALGGSAEVPTLSGGSLEIDVPRGSQNGDILRLRGRGLPFVNRHGRGDLLVRLFIEVPKKLSREHEDLLKQLAEIEGTNISEKRKGFLERLKKYVQNVAPTDR
jgi:molecular chaperone DnaJ